VLGDRLQHRLHVGGRFRGDAQDIADGGLLVQCVLRLVEESHVLDGDDGLGSESLEQRDRLFRIKP